LTSRERAVRDLLVAGRSDHEIAELLHMNERAVRADISGLISKITARASRPRARA
jgi:DNA-binding NarL/FixJ family response regulator